MVNSGVPQCFVANSIRYERNHSLKISSEKASITIFWQFVAFDAFDFQFFTLAVCCDRSRRQKKIDHAANRLR